MAVYDTHTVRQIIATFVLSLQRLERLEGIDAPDFIVEKEFELIDAKVEALRARLLPDGSATANKNHLPQAEA